MDWVSENAVNMGYAVSGNDRLGYDMRYLNESGEMIFVEVKSTSGDFNRFNISGQEVAFGIQNAENYHIFFVTNTLTPELTTAFDLGAIFKDCGSIDDFLSSKELTVEIGDLIVTFT